MGKLIGLQAYFFYLCNNFGGFWAKPAFSMEILAHFANNKN